MEDDTAKQCATNVIDVYHMIQGLTDCGGQAQTTAEPELVSYLSEKLLDLTPAECEMTNLAMDILRTALDTDCSMHQDGPAVQVPGR